MGLCLLLTAALATACAKQPSVNPAALEAVLVQQQERIELQERALESLRQEVQALRSQMLDGARVAARAPVPEEIQAFDGTLDFAGPTELAAARGAGTAAPEAAPAASEASAADSSTGASATPQTGAGTTRQADEKAAEVASEQAGESPMARREKELEAAIPPRVGGVLLKEGRLQIEPQVRYAYSSVNRVEVTGYTILPAITLGVFDVTKRDTSSFTTLLGIRYGILDWLEIDLGVPFIAGWSRSVFDPQNTAPQDRPITVKAEGYDIGDIRLGVRTQLNAGTPKIPSFVAVSARFPTGIDPYEVARTQARDEYLEKELPTGSGFYALSPAVSFVYPTEPGVIFGNVRYTWNIARDITADDVKSGEAYGKVDPGDVIGASLGFGLSLNDSFSVMASYDHSVVFKTYQDGSVVPGSTLLQIGTLGLGGTWRSGPRASYNLFIGIGVTDDAPDVNVGLRVPITFDLY